MDWKEIQDAQRLGSSYANDNAIYFFEKGMTPEQFAAAALENYNVNSEAFNEDSLPSELEADFLFGAKQVCPA